VNIRDFYLEYNFLISDVRYRKNKILEAVCFYCRLEKRKLQVNAYVWLIETASTAVYTVGQIIPISACLSIKTELNFE
jgi:hypothetical protein